jgi:hypothetical protein
MGGIQIKDKLLAWLSTIAFLVCLYFLMSVYIQKRDLEKLRDNSIDRLKNEKKELIKANYEIIDSLKGNILQYELEIKKANSTVDSLKNRKIDIKYIYIEKIKEIKELDATSLNDYWTNELSN